MNYIKHLTGFFDRIVLDRDLNPTHISLYVALFQFWNVNRFQNPISITRDEVMRISKICSKATYHKCMRELHQKGYIKYEPSYNPFKGSMVILFNFSEDLKPVQKRVSTTEKILPNHGQLVNKSGTGSGTGTEQALVPSINYINKTNISNISNLKKRENKIEDEDSNFKNEKIPKEKSSAKKEKAETFADINAQHTKIRQMPDLSAHAKEQSSSPAFAYYTAELQGNSRQKQNAATNPSMEQVRAYFTKNDFPDLEANKFFNYFQSVGWLVGGKTPMSDWMAAANNWILNAPNFSQHDRTDKHRSFDSSTGKDYSEPL